MKKINFFLGMVSFIGAYTITSCNSNEDYEQEFLGLDVSQNVPLTRSGAYDGVIEQNSHWYDEITDKWKEVPKNENECALNALIRVAMNNKTKINRENSDGSKEQKRISSRWTATDAYGYAHEKAFEMFNYKGGELTGSQLHSLGQKLGILKSKEPMHFDSYEDMQRTLSSPEWQAEHPGGSYMINDNNDRHTSIGNGVDRNGNISIWSAEYKGSHQLHRDSYDSNGHNLNKGFDVFF